MSLVFVEYVHDLFGSIRLGLYNGAPFKQVHF
jgi:hypothetical protein